MNTGSVHNDNNKAKEKTRCFVCDADVMGRFYALATCRTQSSQTRVIEKLGELVGEGYMVVISEDDVICRSCGILVNTLDRLEVEMRKARDHILRFLEQKYSLRDGELRGNKPKPCQPPQITRSEMKEAVRLPNKNDSVPGNKRILSKSHSWLQCDKCKYTTHVNSFMVHHLRDHIKERLPCDNCGNVMFPLEAMNHDCGRANVLENKRDETENSDVIMKNGVVEATPLEQTTPTKLILPITPTTPPPLIGLSNCEHLCAPHALSTSDTASSQEPVYVLQSIDMTDINDLTKTTKSNPDSAQKMEAKDKGKGTKQLLTVKEDGSLLVVEVPWNEMEASNIDQLIFE